jgi:hypothetical protein
VLANFAASLTDSLNLNAATVMKLE